MNRVTIKSISKTNKPNIFTLELDTGEKLNFVIDLVAKYKLAKGKTIEQGILNEIIKEQRTIDAKNIALNFVSYRQRTKSEVVQKLSRKNFSEEEIHNAIQFLENFGYIDDLAFAKNYAKLYLEQKKYSIPRIRQILYQKGIDKDIIEEALNNFESDTREYENAFAIAVKKLKQIEKQRKDKPIHRVAQYLRTKGFTWEIIEKVCNNLKNNGEDFQDLEQR